MLALEREKERTSLGSFSTILWSSFHSVEEVRLASDPTGVAIGANNDRLASRRGRTGGDTSIHCQWFPAKAECHAITSTAASTRGYRLGSLMREVGSVRLQNNLIVLTPGCSCHERAK